CGMIANLIYNMGSGILRAIGNSRWPLYFLMVSCLINIILDILFVAVFHWGVAGVGFATVIAQIVSACLICISLSKTTECYQLKLRKIRFHGEMLSHMIRIGLPAGLQSLMYTSTNVIIQSNINSLGTNTIAAWTAYSKIDGIFWMTMNSFGISVTTFVGQNFGAGNYKRVRKGTIVCLKMAASTALIMSFILYFGAPYVYQLFTNDSMVIGKGLEIVHFLAPTFITYVSIEILSGSLRGMGNSFIPMILTSLGVCVLRIIWLIIATPIWPGIKTVVFCYPLTWVVTSILFIFYYRRYTKKTIVSM
ncbi:MAG: MATE family efflux transporter, partial [Herbinix sp.]|nr:MATE family efflux transporter [Herbinix sp.]